MAENKIKLDRALSPEDVGVSSKAIEELLEEYKKSGVEIHSLMILRHGKVAYESWAFPFCPEMPHIMYSVSKSFTSIAVGFAIDEGLLSLDTKLVDVFPEYNDESDERLQKLTVYHLLTMTAGKSVSLVADKTKNKWVEDFFNSQWKFSPGEGWEYISENQYMLCAIIHRITSQSIRDFLQPRLFEPLGIDYPFWETDQNGIEAGGWGLYITTEDLAKVTLCCLDGGKFKGNQVIPEKWVKFATSNLEDNSESNFAPDTTAGYGACFWRNSGAKGYRLDGMFSQFGIVFEDFDACIIITACEVDEQKTRDCLWRHFPDGFFENECKDITVAAPELEDLPELPASKVRSSYTDILKRKKIRLNEKLPLEIISFPLSVLPVFPVYMSYDKAGYCNDFEFDFDYDKKICKMSWIEKDGKNTVFCGLDGRVEFSEMRLGGIDYTASATACWANDCTLLVWIRPLGAIGQRRFRFEFSPDGSIKLYPGSYQNLNDVAENLSLIFVPKAKTSFGKSAISTSFRSVVPALLEPKHSCKLVDRI